MNEQKKKPLPSTAAPKASQRHKDYHNSCNRPSEKTREQLGRILLALALQTPLSPKQQSVLWRAFEFKLRQYVGLRVCGVTP